jgi:CBS domain-containing protein
MAAVHAVALLIEHGFAGVPVVDDDGRVVGVFTEYDALQARANGNRSDPAAGKCRSARSRMTVRG